MQSATLIKVIVLLSTILFFAIGCDGSGNLEESRQWRIAQIEYLENNEAIHTEFYVYDQYGRILEIQEPRGYRQPEKYIFTYDQSNKIVEINGGSLASCTFEYDKSGNNIKFNGTVAKVGSISGEKYYDEHNRLVEEFRTSIWGSAGTIFSYSDQGKLIKEVHYTSDVFNGPVIYFSYDEWGNIEKQKMDDENDGSIDSIITYSYKYGDSGQVLSETREEDFENDGIIDKLIHHKYGYNDLDYKINEEEIVTTYTGSGVFNVIYKRFFVYDENGNVTKSDTFRSDSLGENYYHGINYIWELGPKVEIPEIQGYKCNCPAPDEMMNYSDPN